MTILHDALLERRAIAERADSGPWEWERENNDLINPTIIDHEHGEFGTVLSSYPRIILCGAYVPDDDNAEHIANSDPTTVQLLLDVAIHTERLRLAQVALNATPDHSPEETTAFLTRCDAEDDQERALDALRAHLCGGEDGA